LTSNGGLAPGFVYSITRKAQKSVSEFEDSEQYDLFETLDEKALRHSAGGSLFLGCSRRWDD